MKNRFFLLALLSIITSCTPKKKGETPQPVYPVKVTTVEKENVPIYSELIGHVEPIITVEVQSRVEGTLMKAYFEEGSIVKKGQLLFSIDPRPFEADLQKAKAQQAEAIAMLRLSEEKVKRFLPLVQDEYYSQNDYDTLVQDNEANKAKLQEAQADIESATLNLDYCYIYSPIDGIAGINQTDPGNMVFPSKDEMLVLVNQLEPIFVQFYLPENQLQRLFSYRKRNPIKIEIHLENLEKSIVIGDLKMIDNQVNTDTGTVNVRGIFENKEHLLWPGEFVKTRLIYTVHKDAIVIPSQCIESTPDGHVVYVVKSDNTVDMRQVTLGQRENGSIIVEKGLEEGETVVTEGQLNLYQGTKINIKK